MSTGTGRRRRRGRAARHSADVGRGEQLQGHDEAHDSETHQEKIPACEFKMFEPESQSFVNAADWTTILASSSADPARRNELVPDPTSKFPPLLFVELDGRRPSNHMLRSAARAHVMRRVCKERDDARMSEGAQNSAGGSSSFIDSFGTLSMQSSPPGRNEASAHTASSAWKGELQSVAGPALETRPRSPERNSGLLRGSDGALDLAMPTAFSIWTVDMQHIHHYIQVFAKSLLPMSPVDEAWWFRMALDDEVCYHTTLFVSQAHQSLLTNGVHAIDLDCYRHKGEAIKQINQRLTKNGVAADGGTIAAIACLAAYENLFGSRETTTTHLQGLETIGNLRGGFHGTDMPDFPERLIHWVELSDASAARHMSRFVPQDLLSRDTYELACANSTIFSSAWNSQWGTLAPTTVVFQAYKGMTPAAANVFHRLRQLAHIRAQIHSVWDLDADILHFFTKNVSLLERHINTIINWDPFRDCLRPEQCMNVYGSSLVFIYVALRDIPATSPFLDNFIERFKRVLSGMGLETFCNHFSPEFLLWVLFLMTWIAQGRQDSPWFFKAISWVTQQLGLCTWEQAKKILAGYCIVESVCEALYHRIWIELGYES